MPTGQQNPTTFADQSSWHSIRRSHTCAHTHTTHTSRMHQAHMHIICAHTVLKNSIPQLRTYVHSATTSTGYMTDSSFSTTSYTCKVTETERRSSLPDWKPLYDTLLRITQKASKQAGSARHAQTHTSEKGCEAVWQRSAEQTLHTPTTCHNILRLQTKCSLVCSTTFYAWQVAASISSGEWLAIYLDWRSRPHKYRWTKECSSCTSEPDESELMVSCQALTWAKDDDHSTHSSVARWRQCLHESGATMSSLCYELSLLQQSKTLTIVATSPKFTGFSRHPVKLHTNYG